MGKQGLINKDAVWDCDPNKPCSFDEDGFHECDYVVVGSEEPTYWEVMEMEMSYIPREYVL